MPSTAHLQKPLLPVVFDAVRPLSPTVPTFSMLTTRRLPLKTTDDGTSSNCIAAIPTILRASTHTTSSVYHDGMHKNNDERNNNSKAERYMFNCLFGEIDQHELPVAASVLYSIYWSNAADKRAEMAYCDVENVTSDRTSRDSRSLCRCEVVCEPQRATA